MARRRLRQVAAGLLATVAFTVPSSAQERAPVATFSDTAQVNLVNVDVFVADQAGRPVTGLRPDEFTVFEDGVPVALTNFYASASVAGVAATPTAALNAAPEGGEPAPPLEQRLALVLFVDDTGITPSQRNIALRHARALLDAALKLPHAEVMVVTYAQATRVRQPFTGDPAPLTAALAAVAAEPTDAVGADASNALLEGVISRSGPAQAGGSLASEFDRADALSTLQAVRSAAEQASERTRAMLASMRAFLATLAGLPGRKVVCYVGNGIPQRPGETLLQRWESRFGQSVVAPGFSVPLEVSRLSVVPQLRDLVARANADRVTFYALDAGGGTSDAVSAEQANLDADPSVGRDEPLGRSASLQFLASATGGRVVVSTPRASPALAGIVADLDDYYSLAYAAPHLGDGKEHAITVKVDRPGLTVRHRRHYLDKTADERMADRSLAALMYESGSNALDATVTIGRETVEKSDVFLVPVTVSIPLGRLSLAPGGETLQGAVSIWLAAKDGDDRITPPGKHVFPVHVRRADLPGALGQRVSFVFRLLMRSGPQTVAVSVRDDGSQAESTVTARFTVGRGAPAGGGNVVGMRM